MASVSGSKAKMPVSWARIRPPAARGTTVPIISLKAKDRRSFVEGRVEMEPGSDDIDPEKSLVPPDWAFPQFGAYFPGDFSFEQGVSPYVGCRVRLPTERLVSAPVRKVMTSQYIWALTAERDGYFLWWLQAAV